MENKPARRTFRIPPQHRPQGDDEYHHIPIEQRQVDRPHPFLRQIFCRAQDQQPGTVDLQACDFDRSHGQNGAQSRRQTYCGCRPNPNRGARADHGFPAVGHRHRRIRRSSLRGPESTVSRKARDLHSSLATTGTLKERAFLVGLDYRTRSRTVVGAKHTKGALTGGAQQARDANRLAATSKAPTIPEFSAEESLEELRTLATSAGAEIAGEFLQRRDRPDPATLIGMASWRKSRARRRRSPLICFVRSRPHCLATAQHRKDC